MVSRVFVTLAAAIGIAAPAALAQELRVYSIAGGGREYSPRDGMRATSAYLAPKDLSVRPDGSLLVMDLNLIWRVDDRGRLVRVTGNTARQGTGDGGPARDAPIEGATAIASTADGGMLIAESGSCGVRRIWPDGTITRVAGRRPPDTSSSCWLYPTPATDFGDGGPATDAIIGWPVDVAPTVDGGFLIADANFHRIRKVGADGTISTVAGGGSAGAVSSQAPYSGQATEVVLQSPTDVAPLPDGSFRFVDYYGLHEVGAAGTIRTVIANPLPGSDGFAVGGLTETGIPYGATVRSKGPPPGVRVLDPANLAFGAGPGFFSGFGDPVSRADVPSVVDVEELPGGGLVLGKEDRVLAALPSTTQRLAVAIARESIRSVMHRRVAVRLTVPASLALEVYRGTELVRTFAARRGAGLHFVRVPRGVRPDLYGIRVIATGQDGATTSSRMRVLIGSGLPLRAAERAAADIYWADYARAADQYPYSVIRRCHRFAARRVDCIVGEEGSYPDNPYCIYLAAVFRARTGIVYTRPYGCAGSRAKEFRRAPRWTGKLRIAAPF
jgi:hypothetical protein